jgi:hypothetical protein
MIPHVLLQKLFSRVNWLGSRCLCNCHDEEERTVLVYVTLSMRTSNCKLNRNLESLQSEKSRDAFY